MAVVWQQIKCHIKLANDTTNQYIVIRADTIILVANTISCTQLDLRQQFTSETFLQNDLSFQKTPQSIWVDIAVNRTIPNRLYFHETADASS